MFAEYSFKFFELWIFRNYEQLIKALNFLEKEKLLKHFAQIIPHHLLRPTPSSTFSTVNFIFQLKTLAHKRNNWVICWKVANQRRCWKFYHSNAYLWHRHSLMAGNFHRSFGSSLLFTHSVSSRSKMFSISQLPKTFPILCSMPKLCSVTKFAALCKYDQQKSIRIELHAYHFSFGKHFSFRCYNLSYCLYIASWNLFHVTVYFANPLNSNAYRRVYDAMGSHCER